MRLEQMNLLPATVEQFPSVETTMLDVIFIANVGFDSTCTESNCFGALDIAVVAEISSVAVSVFEASSLLDAVCKR